MNFPDKWFWRYVKTLKVGSRLQQKLAIRALHQDYRPWCWPWLLVRYWKDRRKAG